MSNLPDQDLPDFAGPDFASPEFPDLEIADLETVGTDGLTEERALILPVHGTTVTAEDLRVRMVLASDFDHAMEIDASSVESVGQAVLQLLVAAKAEADAQGQPFIIHNPSTAFVDRVTACGLAAAIGLSVEEELQS
jgi:anti-anti-sigma regulatory factor